MTIKHKLTAEEILSIPHIREGFLHDQAIAEDAYTKYFHRLEPFIILNRCTLYEATASAYCDIFRLTAFRGIDFADIHKRSAFLTKWIAKLRPIYTYQHPKGAVFEWVNELFAISVVLSVMNINPENLLSNTCVYSKTYINNLIYLLHYHACAPEQLASELYLLEQQVEKFKHR